MVARLTKPRIFVVMPFGKKQDHDGSWIDFDAVYDDLFAKALEADFHVHRADKDSRTGNILEDMFKDILLADLVLVDVSIDNPNVWYELGVRHALQARGVLMLRGNDRPIPFDLKPDRIFSYALEDPAPGNAAQARGPSNTDEDAKRIAHWLRTLWAEKHRIDSPVFNNLRGLPEPDWRNLRMPAFEAQWKQLEDYQRLIDAAAKDKKPGDILTLASMPPNRALELQALKIAGKSLNNMGRYKFAKETLEQALEIDPGDPMARQQRAIALGRLGDHSQAEIELKKLVHDHPTGETLGLLGRLSKERWTNSFRGPNTPEDSELSQEASAQSYRLLAAAEAYIRAFKRAPDDYFPGINAVTLSTLYRSLALEDEVEEADLPEAAELYGGVAWALSCAMEQEKQLEGAYSFWSLATRAELAMMSDAPDAEVLRRYRRAARSEQAGWFGIDSARQQLVLLQQVGYRAEVCRDAIADLTQELGKHTQTVSPGQVVLFAGHMIDSKTRPQARFPAESERAAAERIDAALDGLGVGPGDHVVSGAGCGGDLLFLEAARARGAKATVLLPQARAQFLADSVAFADRDAGATRWQDSFKRLEQDSDVVMRVQTQELGAAIALDPEQGAEGRIYERNTIWLIYTAVSMHAAATHVVLLWDGKGGDGPGGTAHMQAEVTRITGEAPVIIDPATL